MSDTSVRELMSLVRQIEADAYERGKADAKREIMKYLTTDASFEPVAGEQTDTAQQQRRPLPATTAQVASDRQRAPKGTARKLIDRALLEKPGLRPAEILRRAESEFEKMVQAPSLRNQLRRGREARRYHRSADGRWYLVNTGKDEAEGNPLQDRPSASNSNQGTRHGAALAE